jgi:hypothetical protein
MFGYRAADTLGRNVSMLMTSHDRAAHDDYVRRYLAGGEARIPRAADVTSASGIAMAANSRYSSASGGFPTPIRAVRRFPARHRRLRRKALATLEHERQVNRLYLDLAQVMLVGHQPCRRGAAASTSARCACCWVNDAQIIDCNWVDSCVAPDDPRHRAQCLSRAAHERQATSRRAASTTCAPPTGEDRFITWRGWRCATPTTWPRA